jgi:hypothetical protein
MQQPQPGAVSLHTMLDDAVDEVSDGEATDEPNEVRPGQSLSCPDCKATDFPSLSKLKSVAHRDKRGIFSSQRIASIGILTIYHANA